MSIKENSQEFNFANEQTCSPESDPFHSDLLEKLPQTIARTFIGTGKIDEINLYLKDNETDLVIFDDELTPTQLRNLEKELNHPIVDRTKLILDIFAHLLRTYHVFSNKKCGNP